MLYTIEQLRTALRAGVVNYFQDNLGQAIDQSESMKDYTDENKQALKDFFTNANDLGVKDKYIFIGEIMDSLDDKHEQRLDKVLTQLELDKSQLTTNGILLEKIISKINSFIGEKKSVNEETHEKTADLNKDVQAAQDEVSGMGDNLKNKKSDQVVEATQNKAVVVENGEGTQNETTNEGTQNTPEVIIGTDVNQFTRTLKKGSTGADVKALQEFLTNNGFDTKGADGKFGNKTASALAAFQKSKGLTPDGVLTVSNYGEYGTLKAISKTVGTSTPQEQVVNAFTKGEKDTGVPQATENVQVVADQIDTTTQSMKDLEARLLLTKELNQNLSKYIEASNRGYSLEALVRKIFGDDKSKEFKSVATEAEKYNEMMKKPENKQKLFNALAYMQNVDTWSGSETINQDTTKIEGQRGAIMKVLPWLFGVYLGDIPLNFVKQMVPGTDINKSIEFKNWIDGGMKGEFEDYFQGNKNTPNPLKEQSVLKQMLKRISLSDKDQEKLLKGKFDELDSATQSLIKTYVEERMVPDLKILYNESFNAFEEGKWYTLGGLFGVFVDKKAGKGKELIAKISKGIKDGKANFAIAKDVINLLRTESQEGGGVRMDYIDNTNSQVDYMSLVQKNNKEIQARSQELIEGGLSRYTKYLAYKDLSKLANLGANPTDKKAINELYALMLATPVNVNAIKAWEKQNRSAKDFLDNTISGKNDLPEKYYLDQIPPKKDLQYRKLGNAKHGAALTGDNEKDYLIATTTTAEKGSNISSLGLAYQSFVKKAGLEGVSYEDFDAAFKNKTRVEIGDLTSEPIINTGRKDHQKTLTSFQELAKKHGDTHVFRLDMKRDFTYVNVDGSEITVTQDYNLYIRPDCTNPLIVPGSVTSEVTKKSPEADPTTWPEFNGQSLTQIRSLLPVVIPWSVFKEPGETTTTETKSNYGSNPGETVKNTDAVTELTSKNATKFTTKAAGETVVKVPTQSVTKGVVTNKATQTVSETVAKSTVDAAAGSTASVGGAGTSGSATVGGGFSIPK